MGLFEKLLGNGQKQTMKKRKGHATAKRSTLSKMNKRTLGSGNLRLAVPVPKGEDKNEWFAANTVDFFNEISLLYGLCMDEAAAKYTKPGEGFPRNYEYLWSESRDRKPIRVSGPEYVDYAMTWISAQIDDNTIFPVLEKDDFPDNFEEYIRDIYKRMFRIFAIIYHRHLKSIEEVEAIRHLNTVFKHFMYFCFEHNMLMDKEFEVLKGPVSKLRQDYDSYAPQKK